MPVKLYLTRFIGDGSPDDPFRSSIAPTIKSMEIGYSMLDLRNQVDYHTTVGACLVRVNARDAQHVTIAALSGVREVGDGKITRTQVLAEIGNDEIVGIPFDPAKPEEFIRSVARLRQTKRRRG